MAEGAPEIAWNSYIVNGTGSAKVDFPGKGKHKNLYGN